MSVAERKFDMAGWTSHSMPTMAAAISSLVGFLPPFAAIAFSTAVFSPSKPCARDNAAARE